MDYYFVVPMLCAAAAAGLIIYAAARFRRTRIARIFYWYAGLILGWLLCDTLAWSGTFIGLTDSAYSVLFRIQAVFWLPFGAAMLHFVYRILDRRNDGLLIFYNSLSVVSLVAGFVSPYIVNGIVHHFWGVSFIGGLLFIPAAFILIAVPAIISAIIIVRFLRSTADAVRTAQARSILSGLVLSMLLAAAADIIMPRLFRTEHFFRLAGIVMFLQLCFFFYALRRYRTLAGPLSSYAGEVMAHMRDGCIIVDRTGRIVYVNERACAFIGTPARPGMPLQEVFMPIEDGQNVTGERGGRLLTMVRNPIERDGMVIGSIIIMHDDSERRAVEQALRENEEKFSKTFRNAPVLLSITDLATGEYIDVNDEAVRISGFSREEIIGHKSYDIGWITREDRDRLVEEMRTCGRIDNMQMDFRAKDGHAVTGIVKGERITIGGRECLLTVTIDITARRHAEEALHTSERRFSQLIRNSFDTVVILDADGIQRYVSDSVVRTLGYQPSEVIDIPVIRELIHPDDQAKVQAAFTGIITTGQGGIQYRHRHKNGGWVHLEAWGTNQLDNPDIRGVVVNVRDITERKRTEEALMRADKLQSLGVLASGIAHEVNQPLMAIGMALDILAMKAADNPYTVEKVSAIKGYVRRITHIVEQIRSFAREQRNDDVSVFAVNDSIRNVLGMVGAQFSLLGIRITEQLDTGEPRVRGNLYRLEQVVLNLITNAKYAVEKKSAGAAASGYVKEIIIATVREGEDILLSVHDNGIGMSEQVRRSLFTPFFTTKPPGDGTGLGLSISFSIVKGMGGDITIESVPDSHSIFTVRLPAVSG